MVEMTEAANILNNATAAQPGHPRRDRPRHEHLRRRVAGLGHHRVSARPRRLPDAVRDALSRTGRAGRPPAAACATTTSWSTNGRTTSSSCTRSPPGSADKSYGIHVAQRAGVPAPVLERAQAVLAELEAHHVQMEARPERPHQPAAAGAGEPVRRAAKIRCWRRCASTI